MSKENQISERGRALILAAAVLDRPNADPDDDIAVLARQFNRAHEELTYMHEKAAQLSVALLTIAKLEPGSKGVFRKYQQAVQTARIALGLEVKK